MARKKCKNYEIGDFVIIDEHLLKFPDSGQIHLLKKQKIGWNVIDGKVIEFGDTVSVLEDFFSKNGIKINNVKDIFVKIDFRLKTHKIISFLKQIFLSEKLNCNVTNDRRSEYFEISGEYLAKVYSGDEYFNDHDCYVGKFCIEKVELQCGNSTIVLPIQFKRLPCIIKKKIRFTKCDGIKVGFFKYKKNKMSTTSHGSNFQLKFGSRSAQLGFSCFFFFRFVFIKIYPIYFENNLFINRISKKLKKI